MRYLIIFLAGCIVSGNTTADTIYLTNGVQFDGIVTQQPDGTYRVQIGSRTLVYRESEIAGVEKNNRTGDIDKDAIRARWMERDRELTRLTGLNADQRRRVDALLARLPGAETTEIIAVRERLVALQKEMDVMRYLEYQLPEMSHILLPQVLDIICHIDAARALKPLRRATQHAFFAVREKALEMLGRLGDRDSIPLIARGLVDESLGVRIAAAYALANVGAIEGTPALIESLKHPDMRVANAARESLEALWHSKIETARPRTVDEWTSFWNVHGADIAAPILPENLEPLIEPGAELHVS